MATNHSRKMIEALAANQPAKFAKMFRTIVGTLAHTAIERSKRSVSSGLMESIPANATAEFRSAVSSRRDTWVPANGGHETPFQTRSGKRLLYVYNPKTEIHAYLDVDSDMVLDDDHANALIDPRTAQLKSYVKESVRRSRLKEASPDPVVYRLLQFLASMPRGRSSIGKLVGNFPGSTSQLTRAIDTAEKNKWVTLIDTPSGAQDSKSHIKITKSGLDVWKNNQINEVYSVADDKRHLTAAAEIFINKTKKPIGPVTFSQLRDALTQYARKNDVYNYNDKADIAAALRDMKLIEQFLGEGIGSLFKKKPKPPAQKSVPDPAAHKPTKPAPKPHNAKNAFKQVFGEVTHDPQKRTELKNKVAAAIHKLDLRLQKNPTPKQRAKIMDLKKNAQEHLRKLQIESTPSQTYRNLLNNLKHQSNKSLSLGDLWRYMSDQGVTQPAARLAVNFGTNVGTLVWKGVPWKNGSFIKITTKGLGGNINEAVKVPFDRLSKAGGDKYDGWYTAEASELGWKPGYWPMEVDIENNRLKLIKKDSDSALYRNSIGTASLTVFNT